MIRSTLFNAAFYSVTACFLLFGSPLLLCPRSWAMAGLSAHARTCCWLLRTIVGTRLDVRGRENLPKGAALIAAKHQSAWDTFGLIPLLHDPAVVMKAELAAIPVYGWFSRKFGMIFVSREQKARALKTMLAEARDRAAAGRHILIFPEGTRQAPGAPPDYKSGVAAVYESLNLPCVPVALNSGLFWPRRQFHRYPGTIIVEFLPQIPAGTPRRIFMAKLEEQIETATGLLVAEGQSARQERGYK